MKNLGVIINKKDATIGTIYCTEFCDYWVYEEQGKFIVEGKVKSLTKPINFIPEDDNYFVVGCFENEEEALKAITKFEKNQWGKK